MGAATKDPMANALLDFISIRESNGNYDAYLGAIDATGTWMDGDVQGTISDVYDFQRQRVDDGAVSSAVGRYQFIQRTLSQLVQQLGIPLQTPFTPALQDQLGTALLNIRGYGRWRNGQIDDQTFMHNLSCEWASLPDPMNGGKSHYDGDSAGNHAGQTLAAFQAALNAARAAK